MANIQQRFESTFVSYTVTRLLGEGGSGRVYEVEDNDSGERLALKSLVPERISSEKVKRFKNELGFCERDVHSRILKVLDYGFELISGIKVPFYVMRKYSHTLRMHMKQGVPMQSKLGVFSNLIDGVEAAHMKGVYHRDIKPENVLSSSEPADLVLADFGIAHFEADLLVESIKTNDASKLANFRYAAPEQRERGAQVDQRADIFALGLILNELFTSSIPLGLNYKTIGEVAPGYSWLDPIVERMLQQDPAKRYQSIEDIKIQLIGRQQEFVQLQKLEESRKTDVVLASAPPEILNISITGLDYDGNSLIFTLNSSPESLWIICFTHPKGNYSSLQGFEPHRYNVEGDKLSIATDEGTVEYLVNKTKDFISMANESFKKELEVQAARNDRETRQAYQAQIEAQEKRLRVLARLNDLDIIDPR